MFVHAVFFWLKNDLTPDQKNQYVAGLRSLAKITSVRQCFIGIPAATDRPIIDRSYSYALTVVFDDAAGHDAYQVHPIHDQFRDECGAFWDKVLIYDSQG
jgi:hypothetical protein